MTEPEQEKQPASDLTPTLVCRLRAGHTLAGGLLDELYRKALIRFSLGYLHSFEEAEDVVQEVFFRVLRSDNIPDNFRAWIYKICRNRCLDFLRARGRKRDDQPLPSEPQIAAQLTGNLTRLVRGEQRSRLWRLLATLSDNQREVLLLRYTESLTRAEIADVLDIPESVVKSRLYEGLERLRQHTSLVDGG
ncbi:MAG: sigma-70 family RNA polymerase sigma factor [bacterium]